MVGGRPTCLSVADGIFTYVPVTAAAKAQGAHLRVHYKNAVEVAAAIRHMTVERAKSYLNNVLEHKEAIPFKHFKGGRGRHAQVSFGPSCFRNSS